MAALTGLVALSSYGEYTLKVSNGKLPEGVVVENLNGSVPLEYGYKNGWTANGWTVGDYGSSRGVLLSPSFLDEGEACESALTLPLLTIEPGEWLFWKSRAAYPIRSEFYTVEIRRKGEEKWIILDEVIASGSLWTQHMVDLSEYASAECEVRFVCRSDKGYMLLMNGISFSTPVDFSLEATNISSKFFGMDEVVDGCVPIDFSVRNLGKPISGATVAVVVEGIPVAEAAAEWQSGETKDFSLLLPLTINERTDYKIEIKKEDGTGLTVDESFAFLSSIKKYMLVDKGTGMWCNNCPVGTLEVDDLEHLYGESLITVETHNGDPLANNIYFNWLGYRAIPRLELDRNKATAGETAKYFKDYICRPTEIGITIEGISDNSDGTIGVAAEVATSEHFADSDRTFRIGYVLTRDVEGEENMRYYQSNNCAIPNYCQYYYLPSTILAPLCRFPNTSLPSPLASNSDDIAFTGIEGSLPDSLDAQKAYSVNWDIPLPTGYDDFHGMRLVAYVLDAGCKKIANTTAVYLDDYSGVGMVHVVCPVSNSNIIYSIDGKELGTSSEGLASGIYIVNGKKVKL